MQASRLFCGVMFMLAAASVQADDWNWSLTPHLWAAGIDGTISSGVVDADFSADFGDIVNVLEGGIIVGFEGRSGRNAILADVVSLALDDDEARATLGGNLAVDVDTLILQAGYGRLMTEGFWLEAGARYWDFETRLDPPLIASIERDSDWVDGFVGVLVESQLGEKWGFRVRGNVGAGGSDLALEVKAEFARKFANGNALTLGFRALDIDRSDDDAPPIDLNVLFAGLTIGYTFNW